jgi:hypothetical protein
MFDAFKNKLLSRGVKKALESHLKNIPEGDKEKILSMIQKNPEFFSKLGVAIEEKIKQGKDQMTAAMEVAQQFKEELKNLSQK